MNECLHICEKVGNTFHQKVDKWKVYWSIISIVKSGFIHSERKNNDKIIDEGCSNAS